MIYYFISLLLLLSLISILHIKSGSINYAYAFCVDHKVLKYANKISTATQKKSVYSDNDGYEISKLSEIEKKLKKYKSQLAKHLKTLEYIYYIESKLFYKTDDKQQHEISILKANVQKSVLQICTYINNYELKKHNI